MYHMFRKMIRSLNKEFYYFQRLLGLAKIEVKVCRASDQSWIRLGSSEYQTKLPLSVHSLRVEQSKCHVMVGHVSALDGACHKMACLREQRYIYDQNLLRDWSAIFTNGPFLPASSKNFLSFFF